MLGNIKSKYFVKLIFSFTMFKKQLEIVKHNKNLQNQIDVNLINYKIFSGRYIEYESNGKTKEYDSYDDHLIYEGE